MYRLFSIGVRFALTASLSALAIAQTPTTNPNTPARTAKNAQVESVAVRGTSDAMEVEIETSGAKVSPETQAITGPDRIVVDFPGAIPSAQLRALSVNRGALKGVRAGLFFSNPPITRVVLDLSEPRSYQVSSTPKGILVRLTVGGEVAGNHQAVQQNVGHGTPMKLATVPASQSIAVQPIATSVPQTAHLQTSAVTTAAAVPVKRMATAVAASEAQAQPAAEETPRKPLVTVTFENGMLHIRSEKGTMAQVLFEVHRQTQADIGIPSGAEQEEVVADLGPGPARDVLSALLNGSPYNFIFVGNATNLEKVILTRKDSNPF